jgi:alpha-glucosidase
MLVNCLQSYEKTENGWLLHADTADVLLVFLTDDIVRIRVNFDRRFDEASYTLVTTAWADRLDPLFEGERRRLCLLARTCSQWRR